MVSTRSAAFLFFAFLAVASCQLLDNSVQLDPEGTFRLDWSVDYTNRSNPTITFETHVKTQGWISIRWQEGYNADFFWAGFDKNSLINSFHHDQHCLMTGSFPSDSCSNGFGPLNDRVEDFQLIAEGYDPISNTTIHRFRRLQDTGDVAQDIIIPNGPFVMGWAWADDIIVPGFGPAPIAKLGTTTVTLIP